MAKNQKQKAPGFVTPAGTFKYPRLTEPDTKFKAQGEYSVKLVMSEEDAQPLVKQLKPHYDAAIQQAKEEYAALPVKTRKSTEFKENPVFSPVYDEDTEEETGEVEFNFKMSASGVNKKTGKAWSRKPVIFDAKGKPTTKISAIWGGTVGKVAFEVSPYYTTTAGAGLSLRLNAVQILELVAGGSKNASAFGFGEEEGFDASEIEDDQEDTDSETSETETETETEEEGTPDF